MMQWTLRFCISFVTATRFIVHRTSESLTWKSNLHRVTLPLHQRRRTMTTMTASCEDNGRGDDEAHVLVTSKIGIIGAGAAGLVAARALSKRLQQQNGNDTFTITVLEKDNDVAGVWNYQSTNTKNRPMYRNLRTNLPKEIMAYREFPWPPTNEKSFVSHYEVAQYLHQYCDQYNIEKYIHTGCNVQQLSLLPGTKSKFSPNSDSEPTWPQIHLEWYNTNDHNSSHSDIFDAVFVCNGHYSVPAIPKIPGLQEFFRGRVLHSIEYDIPAAFEGQTVLCVGGRASGSDLAREIATRPNTMVYLSDTEFPAEQPIVENNVTWLPKTVSILQDGRVQFASTAATNVVIEPIHIDTIIFCTGYDYDFPFINNKSNVSHFDANQRRVQPLYEQLWHADTPNIAFVGLPHSVIPFPLFEVQAEAVVCSWFRTIVDVGVDEDERADSSMLLELPDVSVRNQSALDDAISGGGKEGGRIPQDTHYLGSRQWDYCRRMAKYAGVYDRNFEAYITTNQVRTQFCRFFPRSISYFLYD
jgi:Flavin-binding monooxygenase-like